MYYKESKWEIRHTVDYEYQVTKHLFNLLCCVDFPTPSVVIVTSSCQWARRHLQCRITVAHRRHHRQGTWFSLLPSQAGIKFMLLTININLAVQKYEPKSFRASIDEATALLNEHFPTVLLSANVSSSELLSLGLISSSIQFWIQCSYHLSSAVAHSSRHRQSFSHIFRLVRAPMLKLPNHMTDE